MAFTQKIGVGLMRQECLVSKADNRCANSKPFAHPTLAAVVKNAIGSATQEVTSLSVQKSIQYIDKK